MHSIFVVLYKNISLQMAMFCHSMLVLRSSLFVILDHPMFVFFTVIKKKCDGDFKSRGGYGYSIALPLPLYPFCHRKCMIKKIT